MEPAELLMRVTDSADSLHAMPASMLIFAHPDDETIAVGGRMSRFADACVVQVTDGAPRDEKDSHAYGFGGWPDYRRARQKEFLRVLEVAGLSQVRCEFLGIPDQEASFSLVRIARRIGELIEETRPECIVTHPYEGGHPDHDACAFAVHLAVELRGREEFRPAIVEAAFYHAGPDGMVAGTFAAIPSAANAITRCLTPEERLQKRALLACYATQQQVLANFPLDWECFRIAPDYDFLRQPPGPVLYDSFPWGMNSRRFCELANEAAYQLRPEGTVTCR